MINLTRREFLELGSKMAVVLGMTSSAIPAIADTMEALVTGRSKVLWLQGQACSGCSISFIDSEAPGSAELFTRYISLLFHHTLSATQGEDCMEIIHKTSKKGGHVLVVEGSIPEGMPSACVIGHEYVGDLVVEAAASATHVVSLGACSAFGGIPAADNNPTGAISVPQFLKNKGIKTPSIVIPGCPPHPDWFVGTLVYLIKYGIPPLDSQSRPQMFFGKTIHHNCPRFYDYERSNFAKKFGDPGCLFELGCLGVVTHADCTTRYRNGGVNNCIKSGGPCIGCSSETFSLDATLPFYRKGERKA